VGTKTRTFIAALVLFAVPAAAILAQPLYRWVDDDGVVHFGDRVPPEYADRSRHRLNTQGVAVGYEEGVLSDEERAAQAEAAALAEEEARQRAEVARRDRMLLDTYLSVADIERLRDQRLELLESQIQVTQLYVNNLRERLQRLHTEASRYSPYNESENAPPVPANLAREISETLGSINVYEDSLTRTRAEQEQMRENFARDIARFRELRGGS
jgi:hypothetical protein